MTPVSRIPRVVLLCHHDDPVDREGLASWLASSMTLAGLIVIHDGAGKRWRALTRERRRSGWMGVLDVLAFRVYYRLVLARRDEAWIRQAVARLRANYPADLSAIPAVHVTTPNSGEAQAFLRDVAPDIVIARCKHILKPEVFQIPTGGTFVFHPGICPEYRNAHGCFWALSRRDLSRVGMTLLRVDQGVDTGSVYLQAGYDFDERLESHAVIQHRVVIENLDVIHRTLLDVVNGQATPLETSGRLSAIWGQPRLIAYLKWKRAARARQAGARLQARGAK